MPFERNTFPLSGYTSGDISRFRQFEAPGCVSLRESIERKLVYAQDQGLYVREIVAPLTGQKMEALELVRIHDALCEVFRQHHEKNRKEAGTWPQK